MSQTPRPWSAAELAELETWKTGAVAADRAESELFEQPKPTRGGFHVSYSLPKDQRHPLTMSFRLLDCLRVVMASDDPAYLSVPLVGDFAVVDMLTKEKAHFEMPYGCTPGMVTAMVESTFNAPALRVANKVWVV